MTERGLLPPDFPDRGAVLGVDYGTVRIGLAIGEVASGLVLPLQVLPSPATLEEAAERIADIARGRDAVAVVIGDPLHMSGEASPMSAKVARLQGELVRLLGVPVLLRDERLSSVEAEQSLAAQGLKWWQYEKGRVDTLAAMGLVRELLVERNPELGKVTEDAPPDAPEPDTSRRRRDERKRARKRRRDE